MKILLSIICLSFVMCSSNSGKDLQQGNLGDSTKTKTVMSDSVKKTDEEWKKTLTPEQYRVLREKGTERPYSGEYEKVFSPGTYVCAACGQELFKSDTKFD